MIYESTFLEIGHQNCDKKNWIGGGTFFLFLTWAHLKGSVLRQLNGHSCQRELSFLVVATAPTKLLAPLAIGVQIIVVL